MGKCISLSCLEFFKLVFCDSKKLLSIDRDLIKECRMLHKCIGVVSHWLDDYAKKYVCCNMNMNIAHISTYALSHSLSRSRFLSLSPIGSLWQLDLLITFRLSFNCFTRGKQIEIESQCESEYCCNINKKTTVECRVATP